MGRIFLELISKFLGLFYDLDLCRFCNNNADIKNSILIVKESLKGDPGNYNILIITDSLHKAILKDLSRYQPLDFYWG